MNRKKIIIIPLALLFVMAVFCLVKPNKVPAPWKIIIYSEGTQKEVDRNDENFSKIVDLTNKRFKINLSRAKDVVDDSSIEYQQKDDLGIEFIYPESHTFISLNPFTYDKLYFQLTSKKYGDEQGSVVNTFEYGNNGHYLDCSRGELYYSEELADMAESIN